METWGLIVKKKAGYHISSSLLQHHMLRFQIADKIWDITFNHAIKEKQTALKEYRELKKSSRSLHLTYLEELAAVKAASGNATKASTL